MKEFEYIDDNPGSYFSMLIESVEDKKDTNKKKLKESVVGNAKNWLIDKEGKTPKEAEKIINDSTPEEIEKIALKWTKQGKLKEDKFVPQDKMSKKAQKELNDKKRGTWGNTKPVTRVQPNKKAYDRKRDKKADLDESKKLNESSDGWDESKLYDLSEVLDEIYNLQYEVQNTIRGAYTNAHTYEELGYYVRNLGSNLMDIGDEIMEMEEEDDEEYED